jgi:hypothetical protein
VTEFIQDLNIIAGGTGLSIDAFDNYAGRSAFDDEYLNAAGSKFAFLSLNGAAGAGPPIVVYVKNSAAHADWSAPLSIQGAAGADGASVQDVLDELGVHKITISVNPPSGGVDGDLWFRVVP